jgi:hypothetical protein
MRDQPTPKHNVARRSRSAGPLRLGTLAARWLMAALLLPTLLFGGVNGVRALFLCEMTQSVHATCCCPAAAELPHDAVTRSCCCERVELESSVPRGSLHQDAQVTPHAQALASVSTVWFGAPPSLAPKRYLPPTWLRGSMRARAGPSLVVLHQRFLI